MIRCDKKNSTKEEHEPKYIHFKHCLNNIKYVSYFSILIHVEAYRFTFYDK
jgi:hypothetical protein